MSLLTRIKIGLICAGVAAWFLPMMIFLTATGGVFFKNLKNGPIDLNELTFTDVKPDIAVQGDCYYVYDLVGVNYTEGAENYANIDTSTDNYYYWFVDCGDNALMLVRTDASGALPAYMEDIVNAYWDAETPEDFEANYPGTAYLDGVFIRNEPEIVGFYNEWIGEMSESDDSWKDLMLAPFTLDCSWTYQEHLRQFYWGVAMLAVTVVVIPLLIVFIIKRDKKKAAASVPVGYGSSYNGSYSPYNGIANENYQRQNLSQGYDTYGSYNRSSGGNNQTFQTQGYKSYDPYDTYRSQANTSGDSFQAQGRQGGYNTQNNFQPQNSNSGYRDNAYGNYKNNDNGGW